MGNGTKLLLGFAIIASLGALALPTISRRYRAAHKKPATTAIQPKVTETNITFGKQYWVHNLENQKDIKVYVRDIYLTAPPPYTFGGFVLGGFVPSGRDEDEQSYIRTSMNEVMVFINDSKPAPFRRTLNDGLVLGNVFVASEYIDDWTTFTTSEPVKITIAIPFNCQPKIGKTEYHISLKEFLAAPKTAQNGRGLRPFALLDDHKIDDFLVARCGE